MSQSYQSPKGGSSPSSQHFKIASAAHQQGAIVLCEPEIKLYALLADSHNSAAYGLWAWLRSIDGAGTGFVTVTIDQVRSRLSCSRSTFYRWISSSLFFWSWRNLGQGQFWIQYKSPHRIYKAQRITEVGAIAKLPAIYLERNHRKAAATELETMRLQSQAVYHATRQQKGRIIDPEQAARSNSSPLSSGSSSYDRRFLVLDPNAPICPHGSLRKVASRMGRSISTIQRRLSSEWRSDNDLAPIKRIRTARRLTPSQVESHRYNLHRESIVGLPDYHKPAKFFVNPRSSSYQFVTSIDGQPCFLGGNVYASDIESAGYRHERRGIKSRIAC